MPGSPLELFLAEQRFFSGLSSEAIALLARSAKERALATNKILIRHDDAAASFFLVRKGRISREVPAILGPPLIMHSIGEGEVLGWSWLIPPRRWTLQARVEEPTVVLEFDGATLLARCEKDPALGYELLKRFSSLMSERLTHSRQRMMSEWNPPGFG